MERLLAEAPPLYRFAAALSCVLLPTLFVLQCSSPAAEASAAALRVEGGFRRFSLSVENGARCLDGSAPGGYWAAGNPNQVVVWLEGGGQCDVKEPCRARAFGPSSDHALGRGGSGTWSQHCGRKACGGSLSVLSGNCTVNPAVCNATRVYLRYCSGDRWLGTQAERDAVVGVYFAGHLIILELVKWLQRHSLPAAGGR
eukprot:Hpha_TRINITY_DN17165_c0_g1::TRINITY_DN17165_c0_g1_i1::g.146800::m.146800/K19882/NOTUM; O-palmitoleoyl-L-serine hydrolase